jgi:hypothetical protein
MKLDYEKESKKYIKTKESKIHKFIRLRRQLKSKRVEIQQLMSHGNSKSVIEMYMRIEESAKKVLL